MTQASIGAGNVTIILLGEERVLRPTLRAARSISAKAGGIMSAVQAIGRFDFDAMLTVVSLGLDITKPAEVNDLAEKIYGTGMADLVEPVTTYLSILANGGRPVDAGGSGEPDPR